MNILNKITVVTNPVKLLYSLAGKGFLNWMGDETYLKLAYKLNMHKKLNLRNPVTYNEKLQWLKIHDRKPVYTTMVDKYEAKQYVANIIGSEYIIPTLGVWDHFDDIDFDALPNQFVLKCTHDSGGLIIVKDKSKLDIGKARTKIEKCLKTNFYWVGREWPYKNIHPRIIAERYMEDNETQELRDYKFFAFDGVVKALFIASDRQNSEEETKFDFFDSEFKHLPFTNGHPNANELPKKPATFEEMKNLAEKLSEGFPELRVDFYEVNGKTYFGELTFSHWSGLMPFDPDEWDEKFGEWIKLPESKGGGYGLLGKGYAFWLHKKKEVGLTEYKIFCFNGRAKVILVCKGKAHGNSRTNDFCDLELNRLSFTSLNPNSKGELEKPEELPRMIEIAEKLSNGIPQLRVDFYLIDHQIYFGETTFFHNTGFCSFNPEEWDYKLGSWIQLPEGGYT